MQIATKMLFLVSSIIYLTQNLWKSQLPNAYKLSLYYHLNYTEHKHC